MLKTVNASALDIVSKAEMRRRPEVLHGQTIQVESPHGTVYTTINEDEQGLPLEIFVAVGKAGSDVTADAEGLGRALSAILRMPSAMGPVRRLQVVCKHLHGIGGSRDVGFGPGRVRSIPDAISRAIQMYLAQRSDIENLDSVDTEQTSVTVKAPSGNLCVECGHPTVKQEGCEKCLSCGWSGC